jgi:hypothetical protein
LAKARHDHLRPPLENDPHKDPDHFRPYFFLDLNNFYGSIFSNHFEPSISSIFFSCALLTGCGALS